MDCAGKPAAPRPPRSHDTQPVGIGQFFKEGERIEEIARRADANTYIAKRQHYLTRESEALLGEAAD